MKLNLAMIIFLLTATVSCQVLPSLLVEPTSLPGWRSPVGELLLEDDSFPQGWARIRDLPYDKMTDPTTNHVYRSWWWEMVGSGKVEQDIWRSYTVEDAEKHYAELRQSQFHPSRTPHPDDTFVEFEPPEEITFRSQIADEFYLACGRWGRGPECVVVARYRNYVTQLRIDQEMECEGYTNRGLKYSEIEDLIRAMDARFVEAMEEFYPSPP
ncbi:MAG: hypothetical protein P8Z40_10925 [Chloroflexota bacterium]